MMKPCYNSKQLSEMTGLSVEDVERALQDSGLRVYRMAGVSLVGREDFDAYFESLSNAIFVPEKAGTLKSASRPVHEPAVNKDETRAGCAAGKVCKEPQTPEERRLAIRKWCKDNGATIKSIAKRFTTRSGRQMSVDYLRTILKKGGKNNVTQSMWKEFLLFRHNTDTPRSLPPRRRRTASQECRRKALMAWIESRGQKMAVLAEFLINKDTGKSYSPSYLSRIISKKQRISDELWETFKTVQHIQLPSSLSGQRRRIMRKWCKENGVTCGSLAAMMVGSYTNKKYSRGYIETVVNGNQLVTNQVWSAFKKASGVKEGKDPMVRLYTIEEREKIPKEHVSRVLGDLAGSMPVPIDDARETIASACGVQVETVKGWMVGKSKPARRHLESLEAVFNLDFMKGIA